MISQICKVKGCKKILGKTDGRICNMHKTRWCRHKDFNYISPNWTVLKRGQPCLTPLGYFRINISGKRVLQHDYIMEQHLGRKLTKDERVHHINRIRTDNRIENLELCGNNGEHLSKHHPNMWKLRKKNNTSIDWSLYKDKIPQKRLPRNSIKRKCLVTECSLQAKRKELCLKHYISYRKNWLYK